MATIKKFFSRHPMLPLIIPAGLLIYFVYVALGWNLWVSVSDWEQYSLEASYGFGGFQWYAKMFSDDAFWVALKNTLLLSLANLPRTLVLGLVNGVSIFLCVRYIFPLFFLPALAALISTVLLEPMFRPYMPEEPSEDAA